MLNAIQGIVVCIILSIEVRIGNECVTLNLIQQLMHFYIQ